MLRSVHPEHRDHPVERPRCAVSWTVRQRRGRELSSASGAVRQPATNIRYKTARELAGYEEVLPGAAERLLRMAEREQEQRIEADRTADALAAQQVEALNPRRVRAQSFPGRRLIPPRQQKRTPQRVKG
ncbi:MAG: DUF2335 domain-containing protein [Pseudonocardiales bacterium]